VEFKFLVFSSLNVYERGQLFPGLGATTFVTVFEGVGVFVVPGFMVGDAVGDDDGRTQSTALQALMRPYFQKIDVLGMLSAELAILVRICSRLQSGCCPLISAAIAATYGEAIEVPERYEYEPLYVDIIDTPGAATVTHGP
jgi:hypothetical protein